MQPRNLATALATGRVAIGLAAFVAPRSLRPWLGSAVDDPGARVAVRAFAVRDIALGLGTLSSLDDPARNRNWIEAGIIADAGDFTATAMGGRQHARGAGLGVLAVAGGAAAAGLWLRAQSVDQGAGTGR